MYYQVEVFVSNEYTGLENIQSQINEFLKSGNSRGLKIEPINVSMVETAPSGIGATTYKAILLYKVVT